MRYGKIILCDSANGEGLRNVLFVSGCTHHCKECFNKETWAFQYGNEFTKETEDFLIGKTKSMPVAGITLLGGEPWEPENQEVLLPFLRRFREECPGKTVWAYSGYTWEELHGEGKKRCFCEYTKEMLSLVDILVDGEFEADKKDVRLRFKGSANQRIIDIRKSLAAGIGPDNSWDLVPWKGDALWLI